jgi:diguanylate cyclase (GGDEF)-like protein
MMTMILIRPRRISARWAPTSVLNSLSALRTDPLTGLANQRGCEKIIAAEMARAERERKPLSCILLDIDQLKDVNETYGYLAGDRVLREIGAVLRRAVRPCEVLLVRWGGDEFLIVLPGVDLEQAQYLSDRIRHAVKAHEITGVRQVTVSGGVATINTDYDFAGMLAEADRRLNRAKRRGEGDSTDPHAAVREPRKRGPEDRGSAATVDEPEPERGVDAIKRAGGAPEVG